MVMALSTLHNNFAADGGDHKPKITLPINKKRVEMITIDPSSCVCEITVLIYEHKGTITVHNGGG